MWLAGLLWNGSSYNRDSLAFVHTTEVPYRQGLRNTLDRDSLSGYKFLAAQAVGVTVVVRDRVVRS